MHEYQLTKRLTQLDIQWADCKSCFKWGNVKDKSTLERLEHCRKCREIILNKPVQPDLNTLYTLKIVARINRKDKHK